MSGRVFLCIYADLSDPHPRFEVRIEEEDPLHTQKLSDSILCSVSPLFSPSPTPFIPKVEDDTEIHFFVHQQPFIQIGKLDADSRKKIWFSLGITNLILVASHDSAAELVAKLNSEEILCHETWSVRAGVIAVTPPEVEINAQHATGSILKLTENLPNEDDKRRIVRELYLNFNSLLKRARILMPSLVPTVEKMFKAASAEIETLSQEEGLLQQTLTERSENRIETNTAIQRYLASHKKINLSLDALVQLNSALAYIISQTFYGGPPVLRNLALNSCHSLLGVGTAIKAIQRLTDFIIEGFAEHPVAQIIELKYVDVTVATQLQRDQQHPDGRTVDSYRKQVGRLEQTPKLAYFSTRMGFSEHGYCITAATQCLSSADTARRSLLTLTHELLHSHVKGLLATILAAGSVGTSSNEKQLITLVQEYKQLTSDFRRDRKCQRDWTVSQFLRYRIFVFCDGMHKLVSENPSCEVSHHARKTIDLIPDDDDHAEVGRFTSALGFLQELVVHILDLHYFYDESERVYLGTLWTSWATVPGVADKIEWYVLRSIVAISVINLESLASEDFPDLGSLAQPCGKSIDVRFQAALATLTSVLEDLCVANPDVTMLQVVLAKVKGEPTRLWLREAFFGCHLFGQTVKRFLYSVSLREYFDSYDDPLADQNANGDPIYILETLEFAPGPIRNPIAFLRDRLQREINGPQLEDEEARSAWLFLALASIPTKP